MMTKDRCGAKGLAVPFAAFAGPLDLLTRYAGRSSPRRAWARAAAALPGCSLTLAAFPASRRAWTRAAAAFGPQIDPLDRFDRRSRSGLTPESPVRPAWRAATGI